MLENTERRGGALLAPNLKKKSIDYAFTLAERFCNLALEGSVQFLRAF